MSMKILVVCQYYWPEPFRISDICEAMACRGHQVTVVTGTPNYPEGKIYPGYEGRAHQDEVVRGVRVLRCPIHPRKKGALHRFWNYYSFVFSSKRYLSKLTEDFDVVFINQLSPVMMAEGALQWAGKHGKKCILYCLDLWPESLKAGGIQPGSPIYRVFLGISRRIYRQADRILITSRSFSDYFQSVLGIAPDKLTYLPQYAEDLFEEIPESSADSSVCNVLFAGNVGEMQSVETIVAAARKLQDEPHIHLHIVGDGSALAHCRRIGDRLANLTFHGRKALSEMPAYYAMADAFLVTLAADPGISATLPGKVQSYMAAGKPLIGAVNGETEAVIADADCGLCGPAEDADTLAEHIRAMAADADARIRWGENGRRYYQSHFRKGSFLRQLEEILLQSCK